MRSMHYAALLCALALGLCVSVFAKENHEDAGKFDLSAPAHIGSTVLQPGHYTVEWVGPSGAVHVSILQNGKIVATAQGSITELSRPAPYDSVTVTTKDNGDWLQEIDFGHRKDALVLSGAMS